MADANAEIFRLRAIERAEWAEVYAAFPNLTPAAIRGRFQRQAKRVQYSEPPPKGARHRVEFTEVEGGAVAYSVSTRIKTLAELLAAAKVDLEKWKVERWTANAWEQHSVSDGTVTLYQVKANLVPNPLKRAEALAADLVEAMKRWVPAYPPLPEPVPAEGGQMLEISVPDLHFGRWAWQAETGEGYDMEVAERLFLWAVEELSGRAAGERLSLILLPLGNDLFTADSFAGTTTKGTPQEVHGTYREHFRRVREMAVRAIDMLQQVAPVRVVMVPGNHDRGLVFHLGDALSIWYRRCERVEVDNGPGLRKYVRFGVNLIGFTHGSDEKPGDLPMIMANEQAEEWEKSVFREWHIGHWHRKRETKYLPVAEHGGVRVRVIPSLTAADNWHYEKGYVKGVRAAEAYLWHEWKGMLMLLSANYVPEEEQLLRQS